MRKTIDRQELDLKLAKSIGGKQDKLTAGTGINISSSNEISLKDGFKVYTPSGTTTGTFSYDITGEFSSVKFAIVEIVNTSSAYMISHVTWNVTTITFRYVKRSDPSANSFTEAGIPNTRIIVYGTFR